MELISQVVLLNNVKSQLKKIKYATKSYLHCRNTTNNTNIYRGLNYALLKAFLSDL